MRHRRRRCIGLHYEQWAKHFMPEIVEFSRMSGEIQGDDAVYQRLIHEVALSDVRSSFAMEQIKFATALPWMTRRAGLLGSACERYSGNAVAQRLT